ncbi:MAG: lysine 2,3-aminomutase [Methanobacteriota archaeon]|nr:MAG: lysine 2,3-aminomutase [Euryarchaeota archaeon]
MNSLKYKGYTLRNFEQIEQMKGLGSDIIEAIKVVGHVLPFKVNSYVIDELIDWTDIPNDPIFQLTFPQRGMLLPDDYKRMKKILESGSKEEIEATANEIRRRLNPNPAGQKLHNVPMINGKPIMGMQHKYRETVLFFPKNGQTCFSYCTFCFRWSQFVGIEEFRFANKEVQQLVDYLTEHEEVQDVLFTGGDPMVMKPHVFAEYIRPILEIPHVKTIRIGTKVLAYWPYKLTDMTSEGSAYLDLFKEISDSGKHLAIMAHFNHYRELQTNAVKEATQNLRDVGAVIRTQSPVMNHINADPEVWARMWRMQVDMGMVPYYMFIARDTGAQHYFKVPLVKAWDIFFNAYRKVSGVCRTVRGPSMSTTWGKVEVTGPAQVGNEKVLTLRFIQGRNPDWVGKPFFAKYDENAIWLDELKPAFGEKFFFENETQYLASFDRIKELVELPVASA